MDTTYGTSIPKKSANIVAQWLIPILYIWQLRSCTTVTQTDDYHGFLQYLNESGSNFTICHNFALDTLSKPAFTSILSGDCVQSLVMIS